MNDGGRVLVDTNVWITFLREPLPELGLMVKRGQVITHPCIVGEILAGMVRQREVVSVFLRSLPFAREADLSSILGMIEARHLYGRGLQWNDIQLLASAKLSSASLWTFDKRLTAAAAELGVNYG